MYPQVSLTITRYSPRFIIHCTLSTNVYKYYKFSLHGMRIDVIRYELCTYLYLSFKNRFPLNTFIGFHSCELSCPSSDLRKNEVQIFDRFASIMAVVLKLWIYSVHVNGCEMFTFCDVLHTIKQTNSIMILSKVRGTDSEKNIFKFAVMVNILVLSSWRNKLTCSISKSSSSDKRGNEAIWRPARATALTDSSSNSEYPALFTSEQLGKKWRPSLRPLQVKKSSKLFFFCSVYYLTVLVYTKTTIHLGVGG